jgi:hypothetical protein
MTGCSYFGRIHATHLSRFVPWKEESLAELGDAVGLVCFLSCPILKNLDLLL